MERVGHRGESSEARDGARPRSRGIFARRGKRRPKLLLAATGPPRRASPAAPRRGRGRPPGPRRTPCCDQVVAVDLEPDRSPLRDVAIEPLGAERPGERQLDPGAPAGPLDGLGRAARAPPRRAHAPRPTPRPSAAASTASRARRRPRATARRRPARRPPAASVHGVGPQLEHAPLARAARTPGRASGSAASFRSSASLRSRETVERSARRHSSRGLRLQREPVARRVSRGSQGTRGVVHERAGVQDSQLAPLQVLEAAVGIDQLRIAGAAAPPSR